MPLQNAPPPGLESFVRLVDELEAAIARGDVPGVMAAQANIVGALGPAQAAVGEDHPFLREVESYFYAASAWLNQRTSAGEGGRGVVEVEPSADADSYEALLPGGAAQVAALQSSAVTDVLANLRPEDVRDGETLADAVRRIYRTMYGADLPAALASLLAPYERVYPYREPVTGPVTDGPPGAPGSVVIDFDEPRPRGGPSPDALGPSTADNGAGIGLLVAAGVILFVLAKGKR